MFIDILYYNSGESLKIGSYLHCMIETKDHLEMKAGQSRTVQITVNPRQVFNSVVRVFRKQLISLEGNSLSDLQGGPEKNDSF